MERAGLVYVNREKAEAFAAELALDRRASWTVVSTHAEARRRCERKRFEMAAFLGDRASELATGMVDQGALGRSCVVHVAGASPDEADRAAAMRSYSGHDLHPRSLASWLVSDLEVLLSAEGKTDLVQRAKARTGPKVGFVCASTGGPRFVSEVLKAVDAPGAALVALQHIGDAFARGFARRLSETLNRDVHLVEGETTIRPGEIYVPEGGRHLMVYREGSETKARAVRLRTLEAFKPSIDFALFSAAAHLHDDCVALILTGMGDDGAAGARALVARGARVLCQNPLTSPVPGMPRAALQSARAEVIERDDDLARRFSEELRHGSSAA